jgi:hypothetical protein
MRPVCLSAGMRPAAPAEAPNGARRQCGEPSRRMPAPALEGEVRQHFACET